jgi:hypothetical protein
VIVLVAVAGLQDEGALVVSVSVTLPLKLGAGVNVTPEGLFV